MPDRGAIDVAWLTSWADAPITLPAPGAEGPDSALLALHRPEAHGIAIAGGRVLARCSLWTDGTVRLEGEPVGVIGHFAAAAGADTAVRLLLDAATARAHSAGLTRVIGPMDGNTWRRHRFITERGAEPLFFLESDNPDAWPDWWRAAGFTPLASFFSAMATDLARPDDRVPRARARLEAAGLVLRPLRPDRLGEELRKIHALSLESFARNFLYVPIGEEEFVGQYRAVASTVRPEFVQLAELNGELAGFLFAIPDLAQAARGEPVTSLVLKTLAIRPGRQFAGLGAVLNAIVQESAHRAGFRRIIHAYMHEHNSSLNLSAHSARVFRRYTLFARSTAA